MDTLKYVNQLRDTGLSREQSEGLAKAQKKYLMTY